MKTYLKIKTPPLTNVFRHMIDKKAKAHNLTERQKGYIHHRMVESALLELEVAVEATPPASGREERLNAFMKAKRSLGSVLQSLATNETFRNCLKS